MAGNGLSAFYLLGIEMGPWEDYLLRELTPNLDIVEEIPEPRISWFELDMAIILPDFAQSLLQEKPKTVMTFGYRRQLDTQVSDSVVDQQDAMQNLVGNSLQRDFVTSGLLHQIDDNHMLGISAVMAYQRFSSPDLGYLQFQNSNPLLGTGSPHSSFQESNYGLGVMLALRSELTPGLSFDVGYQSRIDMEAFNNYRGIYSEPSDLDIPAKAHLGLAMKAGDYTSITLGVEHVLYSDTNAFPSRFLPERFVALLGDSTSPVFAWKDLTVYSVGWNWQNENDTRWWLDVSTRQQPSPTAPVLSRALDNTLADSAMLLGFSKRTSEKARFNITAAYASPEYVFGGSVLGVTSENLDQELELEAIWVVKF